MRDVPNFSAPVWRMRIKAVSVVCCLETLNSNISLHSFKLYLTSRNATDYKVMENFHEVCLHDKYYTNTYY